MVVKDTDSRGPYNLPPANHEVDKLTYNPQADARPDSAEFNPDTDSELHSVGARGASNQPTYRDHQTEDRETEESDATGRIPKREINDLLSSATDDERSVSSYTRGNRVDAFKQEREMDRAFDESGVADEEQEIEITAATGRR
ncbi:hypothetical protein C8Q80DRAFT_1269367 [Daedaleopsis nitida]|nr:hypothetical protein C8Q80DRAFT_1269367 [Daedaleopsis nitida]